MRIKTVTRHSVISPYCWKQFSPCSKHIIWHVYIVTVDVWSVHYLL